MARRSVKGNSRSGFRCPFSQDSENGHLPRSATGCGASTSEGNPLNGPSPVIQLICAYNHLPGTIPSLFIRNPKIFVYKDFCRKPHIRIKLHINLRRPHRNRPFDRGKEPLDRLVGTHHFTGYNRTIVYNGSVIFTRQFFQDLLGFDMGPVFLST